MSEETTQIPVKKDTRQKLRNISVKGETYNELIKKLIRTREKFQKIRRFREWFENNFEILGFDKIKETKERGSPNFKMIKDGKEMGVELETLSSNFLKHGHDSEEIDLVLCLLKDEELPVETKEITELELAPEASTPSSRETKYGKILLLLELARMGANVETLETSSQELAKKIGEDQKAVSRWLEELSEQGLVERKTSPKGEDLILTSEGLRFLKSIWLDLQGIFGEVSNQIKLVGQIVSGLGEGSYYMGQEGYQKQFKEKLGFEPYPGTLDLKLKSGSLRLKKRLEIETGIKIEGFSTEERSFGAVKCFPSKIKGEEAAIVLPYRTHHEEDILEVISPVNFREKFGLEDGDELEMEVEI